MIIKRDRRRTHGLSKTPEYSCWAAMKRRCLNPACDRYPLYGGRGITICDRWLIFGNFLADMGPRPPKTSLDRIDTNGSYTPENCRWATQKEQCNNIRKNRTLVVNGETLTLSQFAERTKLPYSTLLDRMVGQGITSVDELIKPPSVGMRRLRATNTGLLRDKWQQRESGNVG